MLRALDIRDMLIIDRLSLVFQPGLNVLTGETGAGKSILLDALGFVLGWRGRAELVRSGASQGSVTATFDLPSGHPARAILEEAGFEPEGEVILRRVNYADGRKAAWLNDRKVSGELLRDLSDTLVELHGQQDDRGLLNPRGHRQLLDEFAAAPDLLKAVRSAWAERRAAAAAREGVAASRDTLRAEEDYLRHAVAELDKLDPKPGEEAELDGLRRLMQGAERIRADIARAAAAISPDGAERMVTNAIRWLDDAATVAEGRLDAPLEALSRASEAIAEADRGIADCLDALNFNPLALEEAEERLFAIRGLARKHGVQPDDLSAHADSLRQRLHAVDASESDMAALDARVRQAEAAYLEVAHAVSTHRRAAAQRLAAAMTAELAPLKMERAAFAVTFAPADPGPDGIDTVTFEVATNPGAPAGPLNRIASGGELSRFLLALKVCLTKGNAGLTLIFDEIDRGVGGATADAVGRRLAELAQAGQVLVVTHSPQVAALGDHHWRVEKSIHGDMTTSRVVALDAAGRVDEIARMLAGGTVTDAARGAARVLLNGADAA